MGQFGRLFDEFGLFRLFSQSFPTFSSIIGSFKKMRDGPTDGQTLLLRCVDASKNVKIARHCVLLLVGFKNLAKMTCCNTNFCIEIGKRHISATKSEAGACLKYQRFQPKRAYKLRSYKKKCVNIFHHCWSGIVGKSKSRYISTGNQSERDPRVDSRQILRRRYTRWFYPIFWSVRLKPLKDLNKRVCT